MRAIVTGGAHGANNEIVDALPRLEIIAINGIGTDAVDLERARARSVLAADNASRVRFPFCGTNAT